uniref:Ral guanine nucleotide dissociation stimulator-like 3a n=1 Tax=Cynoglossus semilaevis TaxID=244447 RepID=A0A3P8WF04_CYNSE
EEPFSIHLNKLLRPQNPVQEWGEEVEDGAVYRVTLRREPAAAAAPPGDKDASCTFVQYRTCKVRRLKAATLELLVNHLLDPTYQEQDYSRIFLSTYRTFTGPSKLIELLFQRRVFCDGSSMLAFVQLWLDDYSEDFRDPPLHRPLRLLLDHLRISSAVHDHMRSQPNFCSLAGQAEGLLQRFQREGDVPPVWLKLWLTLRPVTMLTSTGSTCVSGQDLMVGLHLVQALFVRVVPYQCLGCVWSQRVKKENMSPTIRATITQFNAITNQVIMSLLARIIEKWIGVAQVAEELLLPEGHPVGPSVQRRLQTEENLGCCQQTFPDENCVLTNKDLLGEVRTSERLCSSWCESSLPSQSTSAGVVPYLGTYLTVLTMLDTALPDTVELLRNSHSSVFFLRLQEFEVLSQIRVLQASCSQYNLPRHPRVAAWLQRYRLLTDQERNSPGLCMCVCVCVCVCVGGGSSSLMVLTLSLPLPLSLLSLLAVNSGSKKVPPDQISVSSSGSSGSELGEDLSSPSSSCSIRLQVNTSSSPESPPPSSSSPDCPPAPSQDGSGSKPGLSAHRRSASMTSLPVYNRQVADSCIVRVSVDLPQSRGNMYKSILLTSQDKTAQVIQRALEKHHLEHMEWQEFTLKQVISQDRELLIPDKSNVFYAMSTAANFDFVLRPLPKGQKKPLKATSSLGRFTKQQRVVT